MNSQGNSKKVVSTDKYSDLDLRRGLVPGRIDVQHVGESSLTNTTQTTVWNGAVDTNYPFPIIQQQVSVVSTSTDDNSTGTGALAVRITYLDNTFEEHQEIIVLNGTTPVNSVATNVYRINEFTTFGCGSGKTNAGRIEISNSTDVIGVILAGESIEFKMVYTVRKNHTFYLEKVILSNDSTKIITYEYRFFIPGLNTDFSGGHSVVSSFGELTVTRRSKFFEGVDLEVQAYSATGSGHMTNVQFEGILIKN